MLFQLVLVPVFVCFFSSSFFLLCLLGPCFSIFGRWSTSPDVFCIGGVVPDSRLALLPTANLPVCENRIWNACPVLLWSASNICDIFVRVYFIVFLLWPEMLHHRSGGDISVKFNRVEFLLLWELAFTASSFEKAALIAKTYH